MTPHGHVYDAWATWLAQFENGGEPAMEDLPTIQPELGGPASIRLIQRIDGAVTQRLNHFQDRFRRRVAQCRSLGEYQHFMLDTRRSLRPLVELCTSDRLLAEHRQSLTTQFNEFLDDFQRELERSVRSTGVQGGELLKIVRDLRVNGVKTGKPVEAPVTAARRVIV